MEKQGSSPRSSYQRRLGETERGRQPVRKAFPLPRCVHHLPVATLPASCSQPLCHAAGKGHVVAEMQLSSAGDLAAEMTHALDPMALRVEDSVGWERRQRGMLRGRRLHWRRWKGIVWIPSPTTEEQSSFSVSVLTDPIPPSACSPLPSRNLPGLDAFPENLCVCSC